MSLLHTNSRLTMHFVLCCLYRESAFYHLLWSAYQEEARSLSRRGANKTHSALLTMLLRLRQCCDHFIMTQSSVEERAHDSGDDTAHDDDTDSARVSAVVQRSVIPTTHL